MKRHHHEGRPRRTAVRAGGRRRRAWAITGFWLPGRARATRCGARMCGGNGVEAAGVPRVAAEQPAARPASCRAADRASVSASTAYARAGRVEPAARPEQRGDHQLVGPDRQHQQPGDQRRRLTTPPAQPGPAPGPARRAELGRRWRSRPPGSTRTTSRVPSGRRSQAVPRPGAAADGGPGCGSPRGPTARGTTKPTRGGGRTASAVGVAGPTSVQRRPSRHPGPRERPARCR